MPFLNIAKAVELSTGGSGFSAFSCRKKFISQGISMIQVREESFSLEAQVLKDRAARFFHPESPLKQADKHGGRSYEYRPQQQEMAEEVALALAGNTNLCVEAPTGIGKSFAYLVPAIYHAIDTKYPVLITTETINLQEQLIHKDIPLLEKIMGLEFKTALAKGRGNYLCKRRLSLANGEKSEEFLPYASLQPESVKLAKWASDNGTGDYADIDFRISQELWGSVCCEGGNCAGAKCEFFRSCFYWQARRAWEKADIIVANHALFFVDLKIKEVEKQGETLLPAYKAVIIDEAHTLEDNAANYLGLHLSSSGIRYFLNRLYNPTNGRGLLLRAGKDALELRKAVSDAQDSATAFFNIIDQLPGNGGDSIFRVRKPNPVPDLLSGPLAKLEKMLEDYLKEQDDEGFRTELQSQIDRCAGFAEGIVTFLDMRLDDHVYWIQAASRGASVSHTLYAAPLNVNQMLSNLLFKKDIPVIITSATLTVRKSLDYYRNRIGYCGGSELVLDSPFNHHNQVKIYIPKQMPEPNAPDYFRNAAEQIQNYVTMTHGKAFVLFTSYQMLDACAERLDSFFEHRGIKLLVQGKELSRTMMLKEFRRDTNSVIFGTTSFWTGVDVPGEALSNVIITKLPFAVPTHPLIQARGEKIEAGGGGNSFMDYSLPEAVLKFRQGVGRLIRSHTDNGIIVILDRRVISKRYGRFFLDSIPRCPVEICD